MTTISINATSCIPEKKYQRLRTQNHFRKSSAVLVATITQHS